MSCAFEVIEGEFPDLKNLSGSLGDAVKKVADSAKQIQDGAKDCRGF